MSDLQTDAEELHHLPCIVFIREASFTFVFYVKLKTSVAVKTQPLGHYLIERYLFEDVTVTPESIPDEDVIECYELLRFFVEHLGSTAKITR